MEYLKNLLEQYWYLNLLSAFLVSFLLYYIARFYIIRALRAIASRIQSFWSEALFSQKLLVQLSLLMPFITFHLSSRWLENVPEPLHLILQRITLVAIIFSSLRAVAVFLWGVEREYAKLELARNRPIKGIIQVIMIVLYATGFILTIAAILNKSPLIFLSGLGAMTAVLLLVFRDTILSLVAGVQLTTNDLIRVGDWIEMPQFNADGDVIDIALHSVKVQNWDKTITMIPTHRFLENAFKNWRGMEEAGGRRIKRALYLDLSTTRFLRDDEVASFKNYRLLKDYIEKKERELSSHNQKLGDETDLSYRRLTNIGTFRAYVEQYLKTHAQINQEMTVMVRQLSPSEKGLPLEIYAFIKDKRWAYYESIQSDIFDHLYAVVDKFDLRIYQQPSGKDLQAIAQTGK